MHADATAIGLPYLLPKLKDITIYHGNHATFQRKMQANRL
jgi:hypothetical protein